MRPNNVNGTKVIKFRISESIYNFIKEIAEDTGMSVSEVARNMILYTLFYTFITPNPKSLSELRREVEKILKTKK